MKLIKAGMELGALAWIALETYGAIRVVERSILKLLKARFGDTEERYTTVPPRTKEEE